MLPPVHVPTVGTPRHPAFQPPRHAGQQVGSADEAFGEPLTPNEGTTPPTRRMVARPWACAHGAQMVRDNFNPVPGKVLCAFYMSHRIPFGVCAFSA